MIDYTEWPFTKTSFLPSVPPVDPNAPKPEGSTITPTVGDQLVVSL